MPRLDPAVAELRLAVRRTLAGLDLPDGATVAVACSGGPDSMALLAATVFERRRGAARVVGAVVDHGLQPGSAEHTSAVTARVAGLGAEPVSARVRVDPAPGGVEAGAREARYAALAGIAARCGAAVVLLGHTRDDQAETVLLGLAQGSGGRALAGMPASSIRDGVRFERPLLALTREQTERACAAEGLPVWRDPHNTDPRFARSRVRHAVLPTLERELGPGVGAALARTGEMVTEDLDALDALAQDELAGRDFAAGAEVPPLEGLPRALRTRVLRLAALAAGCPPRDLTRGHVEDLEGLLRARGAAPGLDLPGRVRAVREGGRLRLGRTGHPTTRGRTPGGTA